jgi:osmotically inducible protein OsmC
MATRNGSAEWQGSLEEGSGTITVGNGVHTGPYSAKSRFGDDDGTNPEELLAAAEAGCFTMALSLILGQNGNPPETLSTSARCQLRNIDGTPTITQMQLKVEGKVPGIDQDAFAKAAEAAKKGCVVSRALAGIEEFTLEATLVS